MIRVQKIAYASIRPEFNTDAAWPCAQTSDSLPRVPCHAEALGIVLPMTRASART